MVRRIEMIRGYLPIVTRRTVLGSRRQEIAIRYQLHECRQPFPSFSTKQFLGRQATEKALNLSLAVVDDPHFSGNDKSPQVHQAVDSGIHREKVHVDDWNRNFSNVSTRSSAKKRGLRKS